MVFVSVAVLTAGLMPVHVEIDPEGLTDRFGIPQVRFHTNAEYEHAFAIRDEMYGQMEEILKAAGAVVLPYMKREPYPLGSVTHDGSHSSDDWHKFIERTSRVGRL